MTDVGEAATQECIPSWVLQTDFSQLLNTIIWATCFQDEKLDKNVSEVHLCWNWHLICSLLQCLQLKKGRKEMFYLTTHSTHFIYGYVASNIWLRTIQIVREETRCRHMGLSFRLTARVLLYAPSHRQDSTYHSLYYISRGAWLEWEIAQWVHPMKDRSDDPSHHERTLLPQSYISLLQLKKNSYSTFILWKLNIYKISVAFSMAI